MIETIRVPLDRLAHFRTAAYERHVCALGDGRRGYVLRVYSVYVDGTALTAYDAADVVPVPDRRPSAPDARP